MTITIDAPTLAPSATTRLRDSWTHHDARRPDRPGGPLDARQPHRDRRRRLHRAATRHVGARPAEYRAADRRPPDVPLTCSTSPRRRAAPAARSATALDPCTILPTTGLARLVDARLSQRGPAEERAHGQQCSWDFPDPGGVVDGALTITAWRGDQFFSAGSIGEPLAGLGDEAQIDRASGIVLFRAGDDVLRAHVLSPGRALDVARALADAL